MRIVNVRHIEDCFDGSFIKEILFDSIITKEFIFFLGEEGELQYLGKLKKPFFKIRVKGKYEFKGVQGNRTIRIILKNNPENSLKEFQDRIKEFRARESDRGYHESLKEASCG